MVIVHHVGGGVGGSLSNIIFQKEAIRTNDSYMTLLQKTKGVYAPSVAIEYNDCAVARLNTAMTTHSLSGDLMIVKVVFY